MATTPESQDPPLDIREQIARIDRMQADFGRRLVGSDGAHRAMFAPWAFVLIGMSSGAALFAAGATFAKLLIH